MTAFFRFAPLRWRCWAAGACAGAVVAAAETAKSPAATNAVKPAPAVPAKVVPDTSALILRLQLVWGTDDEKAETGSYKELNSSLKDRFRHLRWKHYFVVKETLARPLTSAPQRVQLSDKCAVEVSDHGNGQVAITILSLRPGQGPSLVKTEFCSMDEFRGGRVFAYAGESKDRWDDAWLAVVTAAR